MMNDEIEKKNQLEKEKKLESTELTYQTSGSDHEIIRTS
jgi:hypothetical protein